MRRKIALGGLVVLAVAGGACSQQPVPLPTLNLERPTDMVMTCMGLFTTPGTAAPAQPAAGRPMNVCHPPGQNDPIPVDVTHRTFAFVTNSSRGELSAIDMDSSKLVDLDPSNPGTNSVPLGVLPEQISASGDGCRLVTANHGSCDLTVVDPAVLMTPTLAVEAQQPISSVPPSTALQTVVVRGSSGAPLGAAPQEVQFLPQDTAALTDQQNLCARDGSFALPVGWSADPSVAPAAPAPWRALVTFPSCDLVAMIDLPSGDIVSSMFVDTATDPTTNAVTISLRDGGTDPQCPVHECAGGAVPTGTPTGATQPGSLAILPDAKRVYVGLAGVPLIATMDIGVDKLSVPNYGGGGIALSENAGGVDRVRLSVDPYASTGVPGQFGRFVGEAPDGSRDYLYAIAHDGTVRVVDVSKRTLRFPETECDTNIDPRNVPVDQRTSPAHACEPLNAALRFPLAVGPGIHLASPPRDIAFADLTLGDQREQVLDGSYAFILTVTGSVFLLNIDPTLRTQTDATTSPGPAALVPEEQPLVNSLRDQNQITFATTMAPNVGPPRLDVAPQIPSTGARVEPIDVTSPVDNATIQVSVADPPVPTSVFFPDRRAVTPQGWNITWQGDFFGPRLFGQVSQEPAGSAATLTDLGVDFCQVGAVKGDIVTLSGCTVDADCGRLRVCRRSTTAPETVGNLPINGLCVDTDPTLQAEQLAACAPLLETVRRYEVTSATVHTLTLQPKRDEAGTSLLNDCGPRPGECNPAIDQTLRSLACVSGSCVQQCDPNAPSCRSGRTCVRYSDGNFCADGPDVMEPARIGNSAAAKTLAQECLAQLTGYKIGAGNAFLVQGTSSLPPLPPTHIGAGECTPPQNPGLRVNRITLSRNPPLCKFDPRPNTSVPVDSSVLLAVVKQTESYSVGSPDPSPNPCFLAQTPPTPDGGTDAGAAADAGDGGVPDEPQTLYFAVFQNQELTFVLSHLEDYNFDNSPIHFDVHGGFQADSVIIPATISIGLPARIVPSPLDSTAQLSDLSPTHEIPYLFVVDQRRLAAAGLAAARGQVLRIHPREPNATLPTLLPIYQDATDSNNLWPIQ
jgi:hypothetical protein